MCRDGVFAIIVKFLPGVGKGMELFTLTGLVRTESIAEHSQPVPSMIPSS